MKATKIITMLILSALLASCTNERGGVSKQGVGTVMGAVGGALIGSQLGKGTGTHVGIALGTLAGAAIGNQIGESLDRADKKYYEQTSYTTLESTPTGKTQTWRNPDTGNWGAFTPTNTFQNSHGNYCREFSQKIVVGGKVQEGYGTACRQPDGSWKIINQ